MISPRDLIAQKRDGGRLERPQVQALVDGAARGTWPDYQLSAMLMAIFFRGLDGGELADLTAAMMRSGAVLDLPGVAGVKVDKHSTGGVGDKVSIPLAPLVAACGVAVPMISGRGLGHSGGTLDKLESIPGFRTDLDAAAFSACVRAHGLCLAGQTGDLAPADRKLYALRDVTATVECIPLIVSSILSKKLAEGVDALVLDVKSGSGAFMREEARALELARTLVRVAHAMGKRVTAFLSDMSRPLGAAIGNACEVRESIELLRGEGPADLRALTLRLGAEMLRLAGAATSVSAGEAQLQAAIDSGAGLAKLREIIAAQGGDAQVVDDPGRLPRAPRSEVVVSERKGYLEIVDCRALGYAALELGAGRTRAEDAVDPRVGLVLLRRAGERIERGDPLVRIEHAGRGLEGARARLVEALRVAAQPPPEEELLRGVVRPGPDEELVEVLAEAGDLDAEAGL